LVLAAIVGGASLTFASWFPTVVSVFGWAEQPGSFASHASIAAPRLQLATLVLVLSATAALLPVWWVAPAQLLLAVLELVLVLSPYRTNRIDPQDTLQALQALRDSPRATVVGPKGQFTGNFGPLLGSVQPTGYNPLISAAYSQLATGTVQNVVVW